MTMRTGVLLGVAAVSLVGLTHTARADDNWERHMRWETQRGSAQDGRGDSMEARSSSRMMMERAPAAPRETVHFTPVTGDKEPAVPLKADVQVRFGEDKDKNVSLPQAQEKPAQQDTAKAATPKVVQQSKPLPLKSEVVVKLGELHDGDNEAAATTSAGASGLTKASVKGAKPGNLASLPLSASAKSKMDEHQDVVDNGDLQ